MTYHGPNPGSTVSHIFDNTVATYKFYWFVSILDIIVKERKNVISFWEIIAGMVAESWYPIHYFKISFGKSDSLYQQSDAIKNFLNIPIDFGKEDIKSTIVDNLSDTKVMGLLKIFTRNVPYRFLSPWISTSNDKEMELRSRRFENGCPYAIYGMEIHVNPEWVPYLAEQYNVLRDFTFWNLNVFLQRRNPNVPDMSSKLVRPIQREPLSHQRKLWSMFLSENSGTECIYTHRILSADNYDLDHFIPWSFVAHNQMWDLLPSDPAINSSKNNLLPPLDSFISPFTRLQHLFLNYIYETTPDERLLEDYLQISDSLSGLVELSDEDFTQAFRKVLSPLNQIASNMGFAYWNYE